MSPDTTPTLLLRSAMACCLAALVLPLLLVEQDGLAAAINGLRFLAEGWQWLAGGLPAWLSLPCLCWAWTELRRGRTRRARQCSIAALMAFLTLLLFRAVPGTALHARIIVGLGPGFLLWLTGIILTVIAASVGPQDSAAGKQNSDQHQE